MGPARTPKTTPRSQSAASAASTRYSSGSSVDGRSVGAGSATSYGGSYGGADSPPHDLGELAAYTRREREKFEALNAAHQVRMQSLMSSALPLSPDVGARAAARGEGGGSTQQRLEVVQRHFAQSRSSRRQPALRAF